ncbi:hypothetical protein [Acidithiobacillus sp.]|uniref:hypothetical protein n=1 Tax=Acidithiobacillus sp. TaxID=1872118 RepID=UPI00260661C3|nr:hypothetical protein [Acidithiobacillus sp.]MDD5278042.1 hypothetical protein [Acidithiobacillus sp.]
MASSHNVDLLSSGLVVKAASSEVYNDKLKAEIDQIMALYNIYPDLMVPVLHDGIASGRRFYILERKDALPLSKIVFDNLRSLAQRRAIVHNALDRIQEAIKIEISEQDAAPTGDMYSRLLEEWEAIKFIHEVFDKQILLDGTPRSLTGHQIIEKALMLSRTEIFSPVEGAHFNFHFGNVLYCEKSDQVNFIDPDCSVRGIDPLFGLSRFAFSFWHELAMEIGDAVKVIPMSDSVMYLLRTSDHRTILNGIPELASILGLIHWIGEAELKKFFVLTTYCFLRSIRINGSGKQWSIPHSPTIAQPEEVLMLGLLTYLNDVAIA